MKEKYLSVITRDLQVRNNQVEAVGTLLKEGSTVPFIARYRKERTQNLDETQILKIKEAIRYFDDLESRKEYILGVIDEQGKLTQELKIEIANIVDNHKLEDLYLPFKPKRKTKASKARELGLEPLAKKLMQQRSDNPMSISKNFLNQGAGSVEEALQGARDIISEWISENAAVRENIRRQFKREAVIKSTVVKSSKDEKYKDYFDYEEPLKKCPSHRVLAVFRGENEGVLKVNISIDSDRACSIIEKQYIKAKNKCGDQVKAAIADAYKRLIKPSIETEIRNLSKTKADTEAIQVFQENLKQLLLSAPLGQVAVLALDPGYRTGCKLVILDKFGNLLEKDTIFPHPPYSRYSEADTKISNYLKSYKVEAIAIGNGTAGRETEEFIRTLDCTKGKSIFLVSESGASIYSASEAAREEFPNEDITVRGAISIGRRLMDPLAELVKIDPKSIGVGQYQHDVNQKRLKESLDQVVESCVNQVGVNLNSASKHLLSYVAGLGPKISENIVNYRLEKGKIKNRKELLKVPKLGKKVFEQAAGFLRIPDATYPLDKSAVHPERYELVEQMATDLNVKLDDILEKNDLIKKLDKTKYLSDEIGNYTLDDIIKELEKPGRDPREKAEEFQFADVHSISDLKEGMVVPGIVTNITKFGAFVDVGVKQDGLVHISQLADRFVSDPADVVKLQQKVNARVLEVDEARKRISLSLKA